MLGRNSGRRGRLLIAGFSSAALVMLLISGGGVAYAAAPSSVPPSCWVSVDLGKSLCVNSSADLFAAVEKQDGVRLAIPGHYAASAVATAPLTETIVSILYDGTGKTGSSFVFTESSSSNCTGWLFGYASLSSYGWNDKVSSFQSYTNCVTTLYQNDNYGGTVYGPVASANSLGAMNNAASSVRVGS